MSIRDVGNDFGVAVAKAISRNSQRTVSIQRVDEDNAYVLVEVDGEPQPVPLTLLALENGILKMKPSVDSMSVVGFLNGDENRPYFIEHSRIDSLVFTQNNLRLEVGTEEGSEYVQMAAENSSMRLEKDAITFNGGKLGSLVVIGKLTERLNKLQGEVDSIQNAIASHSHLVSVTGSATAQTGSTTSTTYGKVTLTNVAEGDFENENIKQ